MFFWPQRRPAPPGTLGGTWQGKLGSNFGDRSSGSTQPLSKDFCIDADASCRRHVQGRYLRISA